MDVESNFFQEAFVEEERALPEPRLIKKKILWERDNASDKMDRLIKYRDVGSFNDYQESFLKYFKNVWIFLPYAESITGEYYGKLHQLDEQIREAQIEFGFDRETVKKWINYWFTLERIIYDIGITKIGIKIKTYEFGYEFLDGLPFNMDREDDGWLRLLQNLKNMKKIIRNDIDLLGLIWGPNRVGKTTLSLECLNKINEGPLTRTNMVLTDEDFWTATNQLPRYSGIHIDEMSDHFYSKNVMRKNQKMKKRKLKKYAMKNMVVMGCDLNLWNIDKEVLSDKLAFAIFIPKRGQFEFYSKSRIKQFEKDPKTGEVQKPNPSFKGRFPKLDTKVWNLYKTLEARKMEVRERQEKEMKKKLNLGEISKKDMIIWMLSKGGQPKAIAKSLDTSVGYVSNIKQNL